jgi:hypothetical protein
VSKCGLVEKLELVELVNHFGEGHEETLREDMVWLSELEGFHMDKKCVPRVNNKSTSSKFILKRGAHNLSLVSQEENVYDKQNTMCGWLKEKMSI